jgi:hypothetical protein
MTQELLFYRVRPIPALRYFKNTVMMTGKSKLNMTMRTIPSLLRRKGDGTEMLGQKENLRGQPRLLLMFTLEESALLGRMLRVVGWLVVCLTVGVAGYVVVRFHGTAAQRHRAPWAVTDAASASFLTS